MFTGIVEEVGIIKGIKKGTDSAVLAIQAKTVLEDIHMGDSIAVNGVCLTVISFSGNEFSADVMHETLNRSALREARSGTAVNLERAMSANGRFGGHIVAGHVDGTGVVTAIEKDDNAVWFTLRAEPSILRYVVEKGSIAMDGISLTVAKVSDETFSVSLIPHTVANTALAKKRVGDTMNLETDMVGKYIEKLLQPQETPRKSGVTREFLLQNGF